MVKEFGHGNLLERNKSTRGRSRRPSPRRGGGVAPRDPFKPSRADPSPRCARRRRNPITRTPHDPEHSPDPTRTLTSTTTSTSTSPRPDPPLTSHPHEYEYYRLSTSPSGSVLPPRFDPRPAPTPTPPLLPTPPPCSPVAVHSPRRPTPLETPHHTPLPPLPPFHRRCHQPCRPRRGLAALARRRRRQRVPGDRVELDRPSRPPVAGRRRPRLLVACDRRWPRLHRRLLRRRVDSARGRRPGLLPRCSDRKRALVGHLSHAGFRQRTPGWCAQHADGHRGHGLRRLARRNGPGVLRRERGNSRGSWTSSSATGSSRAATGSPARRT